MITGVEVGGFQAANIGSSEGILKDQIKFNKNGTPAEDDIIIHVDVTLKMVGLEVEKELWHHIGLAIK